MKPSETAKFLAVVALADNRTVGESDIRMWTDYLPEWIGIEDALEALKAHRQSGPEWLMPSHIIDRVRAIHRERLRNAPVKDIPGDLHQAVERQWCRAFTDAVKAGHWDPNGAADEAMGIHRDPLELQPRKVQSVVQQLANMRSLP